MVPVLITHKRIAAFLYVKCALPQSGEKPFLSQTWRRIVCPAPHARRRSSLNHVEPHSKRLTLFQHFPKRLCNRAG